MTLNARYRVSAEPRFQAGGLTCIRPATRRGFAPKEARRPTRNFTERQSPESQVAFLGDSALLGLRRRRGHDLRRTFITLAQVDGARRDLLETVTHGQRGDIINIYTSFPWPALCDEVAKFKIELREGRYSTGISAGLLHSSEPRGIVGQRRRPQRDSKSPETKRNRARPPHLRRRMGKG